MTIADQCSVRKGVAEWDFHRLQAVVGVAEWQCRDCDMKVEWNSEKAKRWAEWVREIILKANDALGEE